MNVLLINMPFASLRPSIGLGLLKAHLGGIGVTARVAYFNMRFAERLGWQPYGEVAELAPVQALVGEWVFARCLFAGREADDQQWLAMLAERFRLAPERVALYQRARTEAGPFLEECLAAVDWQSYDVVGFTSTFNQNLPALALAQRLKQRYPHLTIVFGGANCEGEMGLQLHRSFPFVDYVCSGEADVSFPRLVQALRDHDPAPAIPGVIARRDGQSVAVALAPERVRHLDDLPYPDYDDYVEPARRLWPNLPDFTVLVETSRGCWWGEKHHCTFCGLNGLGLAYRAKRPARAIEEIRELCRRYAATTVQAVDNIMDMKYFREFLPALKGLGLNVNLVYEVKANLTKEQVRLLAEAGITDIQPGIESFSTNVLHLMDKGTTPLQNVQLLKWCKEAGITPIWNLLYGFPGETEEDYAETAAILDAIHHLDPPRGVGPIRLDRFSPYFDSSARYGLRNVRPDRSYRLIYGLGDDDLQRLAYYFEFDYAGGGDARQALGPAIPALERWSAHAGEGVLTACDGAEVITITDTRDGIAPRVTKLTGPERAVYQYCDQNHTLPQIQVVASEHGMTDNALASFMQRMLAERLMAAAGGRYLSLAVAVPAPHPTDGVLNLWDSVRSALVASAPG